ncbi:MAG: GNAT family N-acetyltransferase [Rhodospirillales bacterium]|nr:GNAT family N-acetyltransferase [Rhodospirillales bacterium]
MSAYPAELAEHWSACGEALEIRPIRPEDAAAHDAFFHRLSPEDIRLRFFAAVRELTPVMMERFTRLDYDRDMAFIAVREATGETVGVARLAREDDPTVAEFAVVVQADEKGHGLGAHLMQRLLGWAWSHGVRKVVGEILAENGPMLDLARYLGFRLHHLPGEPGVIEAVLDLPERPTRGGDPAVKAAA